jgi:cardiolipin synthase
MKLIVQPRDGLAAVLSAIKRARTAVDVLVFRCDLEEIERALSVAVKRGVHVRTLVAHTNKGGEARLRRFEQTMLAAGVTVARTADAYVRYHGKMIIVDRRTLWVLGFNFTRIDIVKSRSFAIVTSRRGEVLEALKLFEADMARESYQPGAGSLVVSPENARAALSNFIVKAKRQLLIYDPKVGDRRMITLLRQRAGAAVAVRIIGKVAASGRDLPNEKYPGTRLHVRAILRDGCDAFVGSQSLRRLELEKRREVGVFIRNRAVVRELVTTFEEDWALTESGRRKLQPKPGHTAE